MVDNNVSEIQSLCTIDQIVLMFSLNIPFSPERALNSPNIDRKAEEYSIMYCKENLQYCALHYFPNVLNVLPFPEDMDHEHQQEILIMSPLNHPLYLFPSSIPRGTTKRIIIIYFLTNFYNTPLSQNFVNCANIFCKVKIFT